MRDSNVNEIPAMLHKNHFLRSWFDNNANPTQSLNISHPANGSQKLIEVEDERKLRHFFEYVGSFLGLGVLG